MKFDVDIIGAKELEETLKRLPGTTRRKVIMPSLRQGGKVVQQLAIANLKTILSPEATGVLVRNIRVYNKKKRGPYYGVMVQVKRGAMNIKTGKKPVRVGLYASVLEYGKKGQAPRSWIRKAAREGTEASLLEITKVFKVQLNVAVMDARK